MLTKYQRQTIKVIDNSEYMDLTEKKTTKNK